MTLTVDGLNECNCDVHKKVGEELLYNSVKTGSQSVWRPDPLVTRCSRESQHPPGGALRPPIESWGSDELEMRCGRKKQHLERLGPRTPVEQPRRTGKKRGYGQ